ncbi:MULTISPECIES: hypothetical protein [unclassified Pseudomonas]|uniref:hypothetical protein n=1 Tax=unclassified Pseudomonas TaxID=196821 RepID=UPI00131B5A81|nr:MULTISPECIES: hypothetical protein [unclassified Pseudomonas]
MTAAAVPILIPSPADVLRKEAKSLASASNQMGERIVRLEHQLAALRRENSDLTAGALRLEHEADQIEQRERQALQMIPIE